MQLRIAPSIAAPNAVTAAPETTVVGLFAGSTTTATRTAALVLPTDSNPVPLQMNVARSYPQFAVLNGERVLLTGGYGTGAFNILASSEIFTFATRTFSNTGAMRLPRARHASAALSDGRVLLTGGETPQGASGVTTATTEIFNPASGQFTDGPAMSVARLNHSAIALDDGRILVLGGNLSRTAETYSATTNSFTRTGDMSVNHGLGHSATKLQDGKVLVLGGDAAQSIQPTAVAELYDPATRTFSAAPAMPGTSYDQTAVFVWKSPTAKP